MYGASVRTCFLPIRHSPCDRCPYFLPHVSPTVVMSVSHASSRPLVTRLESRFLSYQLLPRFADAGLPEMSSLKQGFKHVVTKPCLSCVHMNVSTSILEGMHRDTFLFSKRVVFEECHLLCSCQPGQHAYSLAKCSLILPYPRRRYMYGPLYNCQ